MRTQCQFTVRRFRFDHVTRFAVRCRPNTARSNLSYPRNSKGGSDETGCYADVWNSLRGRTITFTQIAVSVQW